MTRQHFEIIAKHMKRERDRTVVQLRRLKAQHYEQRVLFEVADVFNENMRALRRAMLDINPRFNADKFNEAIGGIVLVGDLEAVTPAPE